MKSDAKQSEAERNHEAHTLHHNTPSFTRLCVNKLHVAHLSPILCVQGATPRMSTSISILSSSARMASDIIAVYKNYSDPEYPCVALTSRLGKVSEILFQNCSFKTIS